MFGRISIFGRVSGRLVATLLLLLGGTSISANALEKTVVGADGSVNIPELTLRLGPTIKRAGIIQFQASDGDHLSRTLLAAVTSAHAGGKNEALKYLSWDVTQPWLSNQRGPMKVSESLYVKALARSRINMKFVPVGRVVPIG